MNQTAEDKAAACRKEGFLKKEVKGGFRLSKKKKTKSFWFELDPFNEAVYYYSAPTQLGAKNSKLIGTFKLEDLSVEDCGTTESPGLAIKPKNGKKLTLIANNVQDRKDWKEALAKAKEFAVATANLMQKLTENSNQGDFLFDFVQETMKVGELDDSNTEKTLESAHSSDGEDDDDESASIVSEGMDSEFVQKLADAASMEELKLALDVQVEDLNGNSITMKSLVDPSVPVLILMLRHYGCALCRQTVSNFITRKGEFYSLGIPLIAVAPGTPAMARDFAKEYDFPGLLCTDSKRKAHAAFQCKRGAKYVVNPSTIEKVSQAYAAGFTQTRDASINSNLDVLQLGGIFLVSQSRGFVFKHHDKFAGDTPPIDSVLSVCRDYLLDSPSENWSSVPPLIKNWANVKVENVVNPIIQSKDPKGWNVETGRNDVIYANITKHVIEDQDADIPFYANHIMSKPHSIYVGDSEGSQISLSADSNASQPELNVTPNPMILIIKPAADGWDAFAIVWTKKGTQRFLIPKKFAASDKDVVNYIKVMNPLLEKAKMYKSKEANMQDHLVDTERKFIIKNYKFGVLYVKEGQTTEEEYYNNKDPSPGFQKFLDLIGTTVELKGWNKFRGGLDVKCNLQGTHSVYTTVNRFEIMFHVSTLLPHKEGDNQRVEKKKHLGNDICILVYKEGNTPFDPSVFKSQFNHVFIVVEPSQDGTSFKVAVANKVGVRPSSPFLPDPPTFKLDSQFRDFILSKLINAERAAMYAAMFTSANKARQSFLCELISRSLRLYQYKNGSSSSRSLSSSNSDRSVLQTAMASGAMTPSAGASVKQFIQGTPNPLNRTSVEEVDLQEPKKETTSSTGDL